RVHGLTRDDFEVFEEKKPQSITNFTEYASNSAQREKRTIVLFIERYPDAAFRVEPAFKAIKSALRDVVAAGDSVTIATWSGSPVIALKSTDDLNAIDSTLDAIAADSMNQGLRTVADFRRYDRDFGIPNILDTVPLFRGDRLELEVQRGLYDFYDVDIDVAG